MDNGKVSVTAQGGIATISFFHPQSNSLPGALLRELGDTITQVSSNPETIVIVLRSEGEKAFFKQYILKNSAVSVEMVYTAFATSDEYQYY
jgi:methylglutaconyl-CoA hydratase